MIVTAAILIPVRAFVLSATLFHPPRAREKLLKLWPSLLVARPALVALTLPALASHQRRTRTLLHRTPRLLPLRAALPHPHGSRQHESRNLTNYPLNTRAFMSTNPVATRLRQGNVLLTTMLIVVFYKPFSVFNISTRGTDQFGLADQ